MAIESDFRWKSRADGLTQPTGIVCVVPQAGGAHELAGERALSEASHFVPTLLRYVTPDRQLQPPPMLFAHTPEYGPSPWLTMATEFSNVLLTMRWFWKEPLEK